jgi:hypothetical protein
MPEDINDADGSFPIPIFRNANLMTITIQNGPYRSANHSRMISNNLIGPCLHGHWAFGVLPEGDTGNT